MIPRHLTLPPTIAAFGQPRRASEIEDTRYPGPPPATP